MFKVSPKKRFSSFFKNEDSRFLLVCGLKFSGVYIVSVAFIYYILWLIVSINSVYFESKITGFTPELRDAFFETIFSFLYRLLPEILMIFVLLFFAGIFVGKVLLRPFEVMAKYAQARTQGEAVTYNPDVFSDYKLLTRFSEFFFLYIENSLSEKKLSKNTIPSIFLKIHTPPFERVFFIHFLVIIILISVLTDLFLFYILTEVRNGLIDLSLEILSTKDLTIGYFFENQSHILETVTVAAFLIITVGYIGLCFHLYSKISGAIFGFFATMRSFMKGNYQARVHLVGYAHIRPLSRSLNKFLDHVERECSIDNK
jgi:hypothetical protein